MRLVVAGAAGRMGRMLVQVINATPGAVVAGALERPGSTALGLDAGLLAGIGDIGVPVTDDPLQALVKADGVIDFTIPASTVELSAIAAQARIVHVIGTTGLAPADLEPLHTDPDWRIRHEVAQRAAPEAIGPLVRDEDPLVRECAQERRRNAGLPEPPPNSNVISVRSRSES